MIIEVTQETTTTRWQDIPIPIRCKNCPYPLCRLHLPGPGWRLPVGRRGAARRKAPDKNRKRGCFLLILVIPF